MPPPAATDAVALPLEQLQQSLWAETRLRVYAVVMGDRIPDLDARLQADGTRDWDPVPLGEDDPAAPAAAALVVALSPDSTLGDWLARQARGDFGAWGVFALSTRPYLAVRAHARALCEATLPDGTSARLAWMDPEILRALLAAAPSQQLQMLFSAFDAVVEPGEAEWTRWSLSMGALETRSTPVRAGGS